MILPFTVLRRLDCVLEATECTCSSTSATKHCAGVHDEKISLKNCIECHASTKDDSVIARDDSFCVGCHHYEAVKIDCFECHSGKRKSA